VAEFAELPWKVRVFLRTYPWRRIDPVPCATLRKPLSALKIALVSTAGLVLPEQPRFDDAIKGGDWSYREIPDDADLRTMIESHRSQSFDHAGVQSDPNLGLPLDRLHELVAEGVVGEANHRHFSLMGSITAPGRLAAQSAPAVADALAADSVDAVLLVPI
jgi:D-proline reductase (dithiol) PrdB